MVGQNRMVSALQRPPSEQVLHCWLVCSGIIAIHHTEKERVPDTARHADAQTRAPVPPVPRVGSS